MQIVAFKYQIIAERRVKIIVWKPFANTLYQIWIGQFLVRNLKKWRIQNDFSFLTRHFVVLIIKRPFPGNIIFQETVF